MTSSPGDARTITSVTAPPNDLMRSLLLAAVLLAPVAAHPDTIALLPATGANVHPGHVSAATDMLRSQLERAGFTVVPVPSPELAAAEATPAQAGEAARAAGASLAVTLRVSRLGALASVRLAAYRPDGTAAHLDELSALGPDDLEPVLRRLAEGLAQRRPARLLAEIDSVTEREADPYLKQVATQVFGLRLGSAFLLNRADAAETTRGAAGGGLFWLYDARTFLADVSFDLNGGDDNRLVALGLGFYYPFSRANFTPYAGGGLAYTWVDTGGEGAQGLAFRGAVGALFGRLSTVQIRLEAGYVVGAFRDGTDASGPVPHGPILSVGLGH
jgi:hypothetical protein